MISQHDQEMGRRHNELWAALPTYIRHSASLLSSQSQDGRSQLGSSTVSVCMDDVMDTFSDISDTGDTSDDDLPPEARNVSRMEDILKDISGSFEEADLAGSPVHEKLAALANSGFRNFTSAEKTKDLLAQHPVPQKCTTITVPRTNQDVNSNFWGQGNGQEPPKIRASGPDICNPSLSLNDFFYGP